MECKKSRGRKLHIYSRTEYYREYYLKHKERYIELYNRKKSEEVVDKDYYINYYRQLVNHV
jgi:hypothetical protein